ncbi:MAG: hypothetical protein KDA79_23070, partial [Planctomycetaceae bacterium]|nr:hypothetical protein [Planctomycetaceae bacterium]
VLRPVATDGRQTTIRQMEILQDGRVLGSTTLPNRYQVDLAKSKVTWKAGIYGPLQGKLLKHEVK